MERNVTLVPGYRSYNRSQSKQGILRHFATISASLHFVGLF